ncbi:unnamed protein product [Paramecium pentaurelia]|uniref:MORN repeat protein n=1 Tax=Paramecium pentaurelia TaxID=43138 RepID=A0A8S1YQC1_9CILI|nr:unnamed protein product [Paramecium pentaurelia]
MFLINQEKQFVWEEGTQMLRAIYWDISVKPSEQKTTTLQITFTNNQEIKYSRDGSILRVDLIEDISRKPEILTNLDQIQNLKWWGQYGKLNQKVGKWTATWNGATMKNLGGYYSNTGNKQGQWITLIENYWSQAKVYEVGEYQDGIRKDNWKYIYVNKKMGGGRYNYEGQKHGKWVELQKNFQDDSQVKYTGEYKNGKKIGIWDIEYLNERRNHFIKIGGGAYNEVGDGLQSGNWVEISDNKNFESDEQIIYIGKYKNGKKVGRWDIWCNVFDEKNLKIIGGGLYDEAGDGLKIGEWIDLNDGFDEQKYVTYHGEYKNDKKVGLWEIWNLCLSQYDYQEKYIGGGLYDEDGEEIKLGKWVQLPDNFRNCQATYNGEYKNGKKVGRWDIWCDVFDENNLNIIGGGLYDEAGDGLKLGNWVEIWDNFEEHEQVTYIGEYKNGNKVGQWDIWYKCLRDYDKIIIKIGGGSYDEDGEGLKQGKWVEVSDNFHIYSQVTYNGEYKNGKKCGRWDIFQRKYRTNYFDYIGGGLYDEKGEGIKLGEWIELSNNYICDGGESFIGEYKNGKKIGEWLSQQYNRVLPYMKYNK